MVLSNQTNYNVVDAKWHDSILIEMLHFLTTTTTKKKKLLLVLQDSVSDFVAGVVVEMMTLSTVWNLLLPLYYPDVKCYSETSYQMQTMMLYK
jgi:hypothetical protein